MKNITDYLLVLVIVSPFICAAVGYGLEGSWQGALLGAGSGMLLGGALRRLIGKLTEAPENDAALPPPTASSSHSKTNKNKNN